MFNPPYSKNVKTNIRNIFLNIIKKHFPPHHKLHKLFNKNTVKISYSCTRNIKAIINSHNAKILFPKKSTEQRTCNCSNKVNCPLEQKCLTTNIVYKSLHQAINIIKRKFISDRVKPPFKNDSQITKSHLI